MKTVKKTLLLVLCFILLCAFKCMSSDLEVIHLKERIVVFVGTSIYALDSNGRNVTYLTGGLVSSSVLCSNNSGTRIYYGDNAEIYSMDADGNNINMLNAPGGVGSISVSPDDKTILYNNGATYKINSDSSGDSLFLSNCYYPTFSPIGDRIAYTYSKSIYTVKVDGTNIKQIVSYPSANSISQLSWSLEGSKVICVMESGGVYNILSVNVNTLQETYIYSSSTSISSPVFFPDGYRVAFLLGTQLCVIGLDGSGLRVISGGLNCTGNLCFVGKSN